MSTYTNPHLIPKVRLHTGEEVPCIGLGTFGSDHVSP
ncbi:MAG: aldo/keto reductase, partial [Clostridiales bacterium]|nr:aldo/keto reductase [Clostridiales bacterium]